MNNLPDISAALFPKDIEAAYISLIKNINEMQKRADIIKETLLKGMEENGIYKIETDDILITYVAPTTRESFDSKTLRAEMPEVYDAYIKISPVAASVRVKVKGDGKR